jgi:hypothetical protein
MYGYGNAVLITWGFGYAAIGNTINAGIICRKALEFVGLYILHYLIVPYHLGYGGFYACSLLGAINLR